jgi:hypothetical protein
MQVKPINMIIQLKAHLKKKKLTRLKKQWNLEHLDNIFVNFPALDVWNVERQ